MVKIQTCSDLMGLLECACLSSYTNTRQELVIQISHNDSYKAWRDKEEDEGEWNEEKNQERIRTIAEDTLLFVFGLRQGKPEKEGKRRQKLARLFWLDQGMEQPDSIDKALATPQLKQYLFYVNKKKEVAYEVHASDDGNILSETLKIRIPLAKKLTKKWMETVQARTNVLFGEDVEYKHKVTSLYKLDGIYIVNR